MKTKTKTKMNAGIPVPGRRYDAYNDGKASPSRHASVVIDRVVGLQELNAVQVNDWKEAIDEDFDSRVDGCIHYRWTPNQFWDWNCDEFAVGHFSNGPWKEKFVFFARRPNGTWYGVNRNYSLDVSGSVRRKFMPMWREAAAECNQAMKWNRKTGAFEYFDMLTGKRIGE